MFRQHILPLGILLFTSVFGLVYATRERSAANAAAASRDQLSASLAEARTEIQTLSSRVNLLTEAAAREAEAREATTPSAVETPIVPAPAQRRPVVRASARPKPKPAEDPRWKRVESRLSEQQSQLVEQRARIAETQESVKRTGDQLDGRINSTRDELNRSIATNHDEVVALQKRGERNIYEFDLTKSKQFQRVGPLSLSLRKADTKHGNYNLTMMVDDKAIDKEHVNLFEPVWISVPDRAQPIQLVVNQIDKNRIRGYISEPKYRSSELAGAPTPAASQAPALKSR